MYCKFCGKYIDDDRTYCPECENEHAPLERTHYVPEEITLNCEGDLEEKKSSKGKTIAIVAAVVAVFGILIALLWNPIVSLLGFGSEFETAQEHFEYVEGKSSKKLADGIAAGYGDMLAMYDGALTASDTELRIQLNEFVLASLSEYLETDISWLDDIMVDLETTGDMEKTGYLLSLGLGETNIISAELIYDLQNYKMLMGFPELSSTYIEMDMSDMTGNEPAMSFDMDMFREFLAVLPSEQVVRSLLNRYINICVSNISNVTSRKETLTIEGVSQKCTVLEARIDQKSLNKILIAVLEEAKNDKELLDMISSIMEHAEPGSSSMLSLGWVVGIDSLIAQLNDPDNLSQDAQDYILWIDYVDSKNNIIGRQISDPASGDSFRYLKVSDGDRFAYELNLVDAFVLSGTGTDKKNQMNGNFVLEISGMDLITIELIDFDSKKLENGDLCGTLRMRPSDEAMEMAIGSTLDIDIALDLILDTYGTSNEIELGLLVSDQTLANITIETQQKEATPVSDPGKTIVVNDEAAIEAWLNSIDFGEVIDNLDEAGVPTEYVSDIEEFSEDWL